MNEHTQDNDNQSRIIGLNFQNDFSFSEIRIFEILKISILRSLSVLVFKHVLTKSEISFFRRKKNDSNRYKMLLYKNIFNCRPYFLSRHKQKPRTDDRIVLKFKRTKKKYWVYIGNGLINKQNMSKKKSKMVQSCCINFVRQVSIILFYFFAHSFNVSITLYGNNGSVKPDWCAHTQDSGTQIFKPFTFFLLCHTRFLLLMVKRFYFYCVALIQNDTLLKAIYVVVAFCEWLS